MRRASALPAVVAFGVLFLNGCDGGDGTAPPEDGAIEVTAATSGDDLDADGYTITVAGGASQSIGINASVTFSGIDTGDHELGLSGVAANCTVAGANPRTVTVSAGGTEEAAFTVTCAAQTGSLEVTASTAGNTLDPDGYTVAVDGAVSQSIGTNGSATFTDVLAGDRQVELSDVASNCSVAGSNPRSVTVASGGTASTSFDITCAMGAFLVTPTGLEFGEVVVGETAPPQMIEVTNVSGSPQTLELAGGGAGVFGGAQNCQGNTLEPDESCQVTYRFTPTEAGDASRSATLGINGQSFTFDFRGVGILDAEDATDPFLVTPFALEFGDVLVGETSSPQMIEVTNVSGSPQTLELAGGGAGVFGGAQNCQGNTLEPDESCQVTYRFTPTEAGDASRSATLGINGHSFTFDFHGLGIMPQP